VDIQRLALIDEGRSAERQINDFFLRNFPDCLEDVATLLRDLCDALH
jgi:hypothetical protein